MRRIAVINQKGGVGKTTTAVNLGAALARLGRRVLICDLDPQCNLTVHVNVDPADGQPSLYEILHGEATLEQALRPTRQPNLWVLPSSVDLAGVELELVNVVGREVILRDAFEVDERAHGGPRWDHVLVDCPPSLGLLSLNALVLCDEVLVPVQSEFFALQGLSKLTEIVDLVQRRLNPRLRVTGLLSCRHDRSTNLGRQVLDDIRVHFGDVLLRSSIRRNVKLAEAPSHGLTIFEYDPESRGAQDYLDLARELLAQELPAGATLPEVALAPPPAVRSTSPPTPPQRSASGRFAKAGQSAASAPAPSPPAPASPPAARKPRVAADGIAAPAKPATRRDAPTGGATEPRRPEPAPAPHKPEPRPAPSKPEPAKPPARPDKPPGPGKPEPKPGPSRREPAPGPSRPEPAVPTPPGEPRSPKLHPPRASEAARSGAAPAPANGHPTGAAARESPPATPVAAPPSAGAQPAPRRTRSRPAPPTPPESASPNP